MVHQYTFFFFLFLASILSAQTTVETIDEVKLVGLRTVFNQDSTSRVSHFIQQKEIERAEAVILTPILNRVPGVLMQQGALNTNRITVRGIGGRSQFSTNRLNAYVGEIPLTDANGETILEDIDMEALSGIEIIKGPNQSIYGSGVGGVIILQPKFEVAEPSLAYHTLVGSYGLQKNSLVYKSASEEASIFVSYHHLQQEGFRENSAYDRKSFNLIGRIKASEKTSLDFTAIYTQLKAFIPSSLSFDNFQQDPSQAAFIWRASQGFESYDRLVLGTSLKHKFSEDVHLSSSVFINFKDAFEPRPFDILGENQLMIGTRNVFHWKPSSVEKKLLVRAGVEAKYEWFSTQTSENLYQQFPGEGSVLGNLLTRFKQERSYFSVFTEAQYTFSEKWSAELGMSLQQTTYTVDDLFLNNGEDLSGSFDYPHSFNPRMGLNYKFASVTSLHASVSKGFSVPSFSESLLPNGRLNADLQPESAWNYEVNFRTKMLQNQLYLEVNAYRMNVSNLLVAQRVAEDQFVGRNAGETRHDGLELLLNSHINLSKNTVLKPYFSGSFNFFEFVEFIDEENDFSGNQLTGIPNRQLNLGLDVFYKDFSFYANWNHVGEIPLNDFNSLNSDAYQLVNIKIAYTKQLFKTFLFTANAGINNLLDEKYAASILPNAVGFGGAQPRYFYPGLPRNYFIGIGLSYLL